MIEAVSSIYKIPGTYQATTDVSRVCSICGRYEFENPNFSSSETWLCPECVVRIRKKIYSEGVEQEKR